MKVLVLGGTGAMGVHLTSFLLNEGHTVTITTRENHQSAGNVNYIKGNARDFDFLSNILQENWDVIVDFMIYNNSQFSQRYEKILLSTKQYVYISSARVYAESKKELTENSALLFDISEDYEFLSKNEYSLNKANQENILKQSAFTNWTIVRPYITYGENRLQLGVFEKEEWLYRALKGKTIVFSDELKNKLTTMTYGEDVAKGIYSLIGNENSLGKTFHIANNKAIKWEGVLNIYTQILEKYTGLRPKVKFVNNEEFKMFRAGDAKYQLIYDRLFNRVFDNSEIAQFVDVQSFKSIEIGLEKCLQSFLQQVSFNQINWTHEAKKDRLTGEFTSLNEIKDFKQKIRYLFFRFFN